LKDILLVAKSGFDKKKKQIKIDGKRGKNLKQSQKGKGNN
jgi:hypothetical protein